MLRPLRLARLLLIVALPGLPALATAAVTFYTDETQFVIDTGAPVVADFNSRPPGPNLAFTLGGVGFAAHPPLNNLFIVDGSAPLLNTNPTPLSRGLTGNGSDDIDVTPPSGTLALGFDTITNRFGPPVVTVYAPDSSVIATHTLTQAPNTFGFFGVLSTTPIGKVRWLADSGQTQNTVIDDVRFTDQPTDIEATSWSRVKRLYR